MGPYLLTEFGDVPYSLTHGTRSLPLGRTLRQKLREMVNLEENVCQITGEVTYAAKDAFIQANIEKLRAMHKDNPNVIAKKVYLDENLQATLNFEAKHSATQSDRKKL